MKNTSWLGQLFMLFLFPLAFSVGAQPGTIRHQIDSLKSHAITLTDDSALAFVYERISHLYSNLDPEEGIRYGQMAAEAASAAGWKRGEALAVLDIGLNFSAKSDYLQASDYYEQALGLYAGMRDSLGMAAVLGNLSSLHRLQSDYPTALEYGFQALEIHERFDRKKNVAILLENIGSIFFEQKEYAKTMEYYERALEINRELKDRQGIARNLSNQGRVYQQQGQHERALELHRQSVQMNRELGNLYSVQVGLANLGVVHHALGQYEEAIALHEEALKISREMKTLSMEAVHLGNRGESYWEMSLATGLSVSGQQELARKAVSSLEKACDICRDLNMQAPLIEFGGYLSKAYFSLGRYKEAYLMSEECSVLRDSVFSENSQLLSLQAETKRQLAMKDKDLIIHQDRLNIARLELQNAKKTRVIYFGIIGLILFLAIRVIYWYRIKVRIQKGILDTIAGKHSHDIRGPVARLIGLVNLMESLPPEDQDNKRIIEGIKRTSMELDEEIKKIIASSSEPE